MKNISTSYVQIISLVTAIPESKSPKIRGTLSSLFTKRYDNTKHNCYLCSPKTRFIYHETKTKAACGFVQATTQTSFVWVICTGDLGRARNTAFTLGIVSIFCSTTGLSAWWLCSATEYLVKWLWFRHERSCPQQIFPSHVVTVVYNCGIVWEPSSPNYSHINRNSSRRVSVVSHTKLGATKRKGSEAWDS